MTRKEAKKFWLIRYENAKDFNDPNWEAQERREHREYVEALAMAIEALSAEAVQGWIPCSERLPDEKGEYLVTYHPCYWDDVKTDIRVGIDSFRGKTTWAKHKHQRVIAWMPLPTPYKGGGDK